MGTKKSNKLYAAAAALAVTASAVAPGLSADAATKVTVKSVVNPASISHYGGYANSVKKLSLPKTVKVMLSNKKTENRSVKWGKVAYDAKYVGKYQTITGTVSGTSLKATIKVKLNNYPIDVVEPKLAPVAVGEAVKLPSTITVKYKNGNSIERSIKSFTISKADTSKAGKMKLSYSYKGLNLEIKGSIAYEVKKAEITNVMDSVKEDTLSVSADVKYPAKGAKAQLLIFAGKDESKGLDPVEGKIENGKFMAEGKMIPDGTHSYKIKVGDVVSAAKEFKVDNAPKVEGVKANNLKTIEVNFNKAVDEKTVSASNFKVYKDDATTETAKTVVLSEDKKTATLVFADGTLAQSTSLKVLVENIKDVTGKTVAKSETTVVVKDMKEPEALDAKFVNAKTVKINFSEPVKFATVSKVFDELLIDGNKVAGTSSISDDLKTVTIALNTAVVSGSHTLKVAPVADYANFKTLEKTFESSVAVDNGAPELIKAVADQRNVLELTFSEAIDKVAGSIKVGTTVYNVNSSAVTVDGSKVKIVLAPALDSVDAFVEKTIVYKGIKDALGNESNNVDGQEFKFTATNDTTKPTASVSIDANNVIKVLFSEKVQGFTSANYELKNKDGVVISSSPTAVGTEGKEFSISLTNANVDTQDLTLKIKDVLDNSVRQNKSDESTTTVTTNDKNAPTVTGSLTKLGSPTDTFRIAFSEEMDKTTLLDKANYLVDVDGAGAGTGTEVALGSVANAVISVSADGKSVDVTLPGLTAGTTQIKLLNLKDAKGTRIASADFNTSKTVAATGTFNQTNVSAQATGRNTIVLTATSGNAFGSIVEPNSIKIEDVAAPSASLYVTGSVRSSDGTKLTLTLNAPLSYNAKSGTSAVKIYTVGTGVQNTNGVALTISSGTNAVSVTDAIRPEVSSVAGTTLGSDTDEFKITFTEAIDADITNTSILNDLVVKNADGQTLSIDPADLAFNAARTELTVSLNDASSAADEFAGTYSVQVLDRVIKDEDGVATTGFGTNVVVGKTVTGVIVK